MGICKGIFSFILTLSKVNKIYSEVKPLVASDGLHCSSDLQFLRGLHTDGELVWPNARFPIGMAWPQDP